MLSLTFRFSDQNFVFVCHFSMHDTCHVHLILLTLLHFKPQSSSPIFRVKLRWRQHGPPKRRYPTTPLHSVAIQKAVTWIFIALITSNVASSLHSFSLCFKSLQQFYQPYDAPGAIDVTCWSRIVISEIWMLVLVLVLLLFY
jgi:hypothetical protein